MSALVVEVFRTDDYVADFEVELMPMLREAFDGAIEAGTGDVAFDLFFYKLTDPTPDPGPPTLVNLRASHGFVRVRIWRRGELLYQHPHPVRELVGEPLRKLLLQREPEVTHWGYGVRGDGLESIPLRRPAPPVAHEMRARRTRRRWSYEVHEVLGPEPPESSLALLGADVEPVRTGPLPTMPLPLSREGAASGAGQALVAVEQDPPAPAVNGDVASPSPAVEPGPPDPPTPPVVIVIPRALLTSLVQTFPFSEEIEEGGFLAGRVYRDAERTGGYIVQVSSAIPAERTGASMLNFTFTGESFLRVSAQLAARPEGDVLLGWYHTHLFPATFRSGLSSVDVELHRSTFRRPWQVAALVNLSADGRVLRFYHGTGAEMTKIPYWEVP